MLANKSNKKAVKKFRTSHFDERNVTLVLSILGNRFRWD